MSLKFIVISIFLTTSLLSYQSEKYIEAIVIGKVAKYIKWSKRDSKFFIISVLHNPFEENLDTIYKNRKIDGKRVKIVYIKNIDELPKNSNILYISKEETLNLADIINSVKDKSILTISKIQGFAQKNGILQLYFVERKIKFKINLDSAKRANIQIKSNLLNISEVLQKGDS